MNKSNMKPKTRLPRGLWVGKIRKPVRLWSDPAVPEYFDHYYYRVRVAGHPQMLRAAETAVMSEAIAKGKLALEAVRSDKWTQIRDILDGGRARRRETVTLGTFLLAFEMVATARQMKGWEFARNDLRMVAAVAHGMIPALNGLLNADGGRLVRAVDALDVAQVLSEESATEYARRMQMAAGVHVTDAHGRELLNLDRNNPPEINATINSVLSNARLPLHQQNRIDEIAELKIDWARAEGFLRLRMPIRTTVTLGTFLAAFEEVCRARKKSQYKRMMSSVRLVAAIAQGWLMPFSGERMTLEIRQRVDALDVLEVLNKHTAMEYARRCQIMATVLEELDEETEDEECSAEAQALYGLRLASEQINLDEALPPLVNRTIMSTLGMARNVLAPRMRQLAVDALPIDWMRAEQFRALSLQCPTVRIEESMPTRAQMDAMMEGWRTLAQSADVMQREMALVNELLRLLGLRSGELVMARESWLWESDGRWFLWVKNRREECFKCKSRNEAKLPLSSDLATRLRQRCADAVGSGMKNPFLILPMVEGGKVPGQENKQRAEFVRTRHNAWLKSFLGEVRTRQGNHRLRKWCATRLFKLAMDSHGDEAKAAIEVKNYLRHSKEATALVHYIAKNDELLRTVTDE